MLIVGNLTLREGFESSRGAGSWILGCFKLPAAEEDIKIIAFEYNYNIYSHKVFKVVLGLDFLLRTFFLNDQLFLRGRSFGAQNFIFYGRGDINDGIFE